MSKKLMLAAMALTAACSLSAKEITAQAALERAVGASQGAAKAPVAAMSLRSVVNSADNTPALYLFASDSRMMVLPADDRADAVLAYIDNPSGELPPQLQWWLRGYADQIEYMQAHESGSGLYITPQPAASPDTKAPIAPLVSTTWDQDSPYNLLCPMDGSSRCVTGCVATAAAQVINYHKYPAKGTGTISYTDSKKVTRTLNLSLKSFDWENMLDSYAGEYTSAQANAVAYLMEVCGYASKMNYSASESGANSTNMVNGVKQYLGYNSAMKVLSREYYGIADWENIVYEQIQKVGPVYYAGDDQLQGGHAFVCDGYSSDGYFHFNWGWSGAYDGYYKLTALVPQGQGIGGNSGGFNFGQEVVVNFTKPGNTTVDISEPSLTLVGNLEVELGEQTDVNITSDGVSQARVFIYNSSDKTSNFYFGLRAIKVGETQAIDAYDSRVANLGPNSGLTSIDLELPDFPSVGTYNVYLIYREGTTGEWQQPKHAIGAAYFFTASVARGGLINSVTAAGGGEVTLNNLAVNSDVYIGKRLKYSCTLVNDTDTEIYDGVMPFIFTISNGQAVIKAIGEAYAFDMMPGESQQITADPEMYAYSSSTSSFSGNAYFGLISVNTADIIKYMQVNVKKATTLNASSTTFTFDGNANAADANNMQFNCGLKVTSGYWASPLSVYLCDTSSGLMLQTLNSSEVYYLSSGQSATSTVAGSFPGATAGTTYNAVFGYIDGQYVMSLRTMNIRIAKAFSGVEGVTADAASAVSIRYDASASAVSIEAPSAIASVEVYNIDGSRSAAEIDINGSAAVAALVAAPYGIKIVKVTLTDGTVAISKIVR